MCERVGTFILSASAGAGGVDLFLKGGFCSKSEPSNELVLSNSQARRILARHYCSRSLLFFPRTSHVRTDQELSSSGFRVPAGFLALDSKSHRRRATLTLCVVLPATTRSRPTRTWMTSKQGKEPQKPQLRRPRSPATSGWCIPTGCALPFLDLPRWTSPHTPPPAAFSFLRFPHPQGVLQTISPSLDSSSQISLLSGCAETLAHRCLTTQDATGQRAGRASTGGAGSRKGPEQCPSARRRATWTASGADGEPGRKCLFIRGGRRQRR